MDRVELTTTPKSLNNSRKRMADEVLRNNESEQTPVNQTLRLDDIPVRVEDGEEGKEEDGASWRSRKPK
jgi:hypothetical protein